MIISFDHTEPQNSMIIWNKDAVIESTSNAQGPLMGGGLGDDDTLMGGM